MKRFRSTALAAALTAIVATLVPAAPASTGLAGPRHLVVLPRDGTEGAQPSATRRTRASTAS